MFIFRCKYINKYLSAQKYFKLFTYCHIYISIYIFICFVMYLFIYLYNYLFICNIICLYFYIFIFRNGYRKLEGDRRQMWEEPEKDKGRDMAGQEGGGEGDRGMGEGEKGKPGATYWEGSGGGTAAERIMGRKAVERVGCDRWGKFMGRMGEIHGKNERGYWEE
jgi:hypothetical protein